LKGGCARKLDGAWSEHTVNIEPGQCSYRLPNGWRDSLPLCSSRERPIPSPHGVSSTPASSRKSRWSRYVAEQIAAGLLAADPALRTEFTAKLTSDPYFAASASDRLEFFCAGTFLGTNGTTFTR